MQDSDGKIKSTFWNSFLIGVPGLAGGLIGYLLVGVVSNQESSVVNAAFSHAQIWQRLWPNQANGIGLLLWILIAAVPGLFLVARSFPALKTIDQRFRYLVISGILGVFFLGGIFVSIKIGAGSDLHNFDAFLLLLLIAAVYEIKQQLPFSLPEFNRSVFFAAVFSFLFLLPGLFVLHRTNSIQVYDNTAAYQTISEIQEIIDTSNQAGEEVLLADEQHLILFGKLEDINYYSHFDKAVVLEVVMAKDTDYINRHYQAPLAEQQFDVIIIEVQPRQYKDPSTSMWAEENNLYLDLFSKTLWEYYDLDMSLNNGSLEVYLSKADN